MGASSVELSPPQEKKVAAHIAAVKRRAIIVISEIILGIGHPNLQKY